MITLVLLSLLSSIISEAAPTYQYHYCSNETFTPNSTYQSNLNLVLSSLSSNSSIESGFYNITVGQNSSNNTIYSLFLCRGDVTTEVCQVCVATATKNLVQQYCPRGRWVVIWYDECMLRYSEPNFFIIMDDQVFMSGTTPLFDCRKCLRGEIVYLPTSCSGTQMARGLYPSCNVRYDMHPFYRIIPSPPLLPPPPAPPGKRQSSSVRIIAIVTSIAVSVVLLTMVYCFCGRKLKKKYKVKEEDEYFLTFTFWCLIFDLATLKAATNNFSDENKLGKGGFGVVYKLHKSILLGALLGGQEIAVKRLSSSSKQGVEEFKDEVSLLAKLQHRNLVRLLGFCLEGKEKILVYEYVPNKSLDYFLFAKTVLDWSSRYKIIASNILLDEEMNPKVSDFGMVRIFGIDQTQDNTRKIVGTYGYMPPRICDTKSDVYSFGVLILEILSGKKNSSFSTSSTTENLLSYRFLFKRCIHIGLECIQESPTERPTMASIVLMLNSHSELGSDQSTSNGIPSFVNESSITEVYPR
ncbi:hypothetical protein ACB092_05G247800 [Castanea dentata]